jgi:hypothetical protein
MLLLLTEALTNKTIIIGIANIIEIKEFVIKSSDGDATECTRIQSTGAMVATSYVKESVDEIWTQYKLNQIK